MAVEIRVPAMGESIVDAVIARWLKKEGEKVQKDEILVELETDKVNLDVTASESGVLQQIAKQEGDTVGVGELLGLISAGSGSNGVTPPAVPAQETQPIPSAPVAVAQPAPSAETGERSPTPVARKIAAENKVDLAEVKGTQGRVRKEDVLNYIEHKPAEAAAQPNPPTPFPSKEGGIKTDVTAQPDRPPTPTNGRREERVRLTRRRQTIAQRLVEAQHTAAMLTTFNEVDMSAIMEVRSRRKDSFKERNGVSLGFMSFFTKAVVGALKAFPRLNAEIQGNEMVLKHYYDIGIAVGADEGLVVPVLRDADHQNFAEIEREIAALAKRARENSLTLQELQGGTFTITNGGVFGSLLSTPILNAPQVGILGMHKIEQRPIALNGQVVIRPMMYLALSYDHRIVDGSEAVKFLVRVKELLEDPETLLLEG